MPTISLGHICIRNPRVFPRDIKKIANYRPCRRARWIREPSEVTEVNKEVKEKEDGKGINGIDEKELHNRAGRMGRNDMRLYTYMRSRPPRVPF
jgi:hypothetical protein